MLGAIAVLILTPVLWILSHKYFRFIYFGNIGNAILKEILECFVISFLLVCFVGAVFNSAFSGGGKSAGQLKQEYSYEVAVQDELDDAVDIDANIDMGAEPLDEPTFKALLGLYASQGWVNNLDALFETLYSNATMKIDPAISEKSEYVSAYSCSKYDNPNDYSGSDFILNWPYPETFREEREEVFKLLSELDGMSVAYSNWQVDDDKFIPIEEVSDGVFQRVAPNATNGVLYYYGDILNNKPSGFGAILTLYGGNYLALVPTFVGHFSDGLVKGYGIQFSDGTNRQLVSGYGFSGAQMEGLFDFSTEDILIGVYNDLNGQGIVYYNNNCSYLNDYLAELSISDIQLYSNENMNTVVDIPVITNYPVLRPSVAYEGHFSQGDFAGDLEYFYRSDGRCYGNICFCGEYSPCEDVPATGIAYAADGSIISASFINDPIVSSRIEALGFVYYPSGSLEFVGEFCIEDYTLNDFIRKEYSCGKYYDTDGTLLGEYNNGNYVWAQ